MLNFFPIYVQNSFGVQSWTRKLTLWYPSFHLPQLYYHLLLKLSVPPLEPHFESWTEHYAWREVEVNSLVYNIYAVNSPFDIRCFSQKKKNNIQCPKFLQTEDKYFFPFLFFFLRGGWEAVLCCPTYWNLSSLTRDQTWAPDSESAES